MQAMQHRILVVDNDGPQRRSLCLGLELLGFSPIEAASAGNAVSILDTVTVTLALVDVGLTDDSSVQLVRRLQFRYPRLPVVLTSGGYAGISERERATMSNVVAFVPKPYNLDELASFLQRKLEQAVAG
jgi:DNA-binding NtrC family response regulator